MRLNKYLVVIVSLMIVAVLFRIFNNHYHIRAFVNFSPIAAIALFGASNLKNRVMGFVMPMLVLLMSDYVIGFHNTMFFTYGSFALISVIGFTILGNKFSAGRMIASSLLASLVFFIITNFGVWLMQDLYAKSFSGLLNCYISAIPFFGRTIIGDLFFSAALFGAFEWIKQTNWLVKAKA